MTEAVDPVVFRLAIFVLAIFVVVAPKLMQNLRGRGSRKNA